jgi:hypothetical protein
MTAFELGVIQLSRERALLIVPQALLRGSNAATTMDDFRINEPISNSRAMEETQP